MKHLVKVKNETLGFAPNNKCRVIFLNDWWTIFCLHHDWLWSNAFLYVDHWRKIPLGNLSNFQTHLRKKTELDMLLSFGYIALFWTWTTHSCRNWRSNWTYSHYWENSQKLFFKLLQRRVSKIILDQKNQSLVERKLSSWSSVWKHLNKRLLAIFSEAGKICYLTLSLIATLNKLKNIL